MDGRGSWMPENGKKFCGSTKMLMAAQHFTPPCTQAEVTSDVHKSSTSTSGFLKGSASRQ